MGQATPTKQMLSDQAYEHLRTEILRGAFGPGDPLKPQELAGAIGVSLAVVREALLRLVGEGLADRLPNRGFAVPMFSDLRWQQVSEARRVIEPTTLRLSIERGDLDWEARVRAAHHRLTRTPPFAEGEGPHYSEAWAAAHYAFHRALLDGCGNPVLLETFDRLWTASELARRWSGQRAPDRDHVGEHRLLEEAALARDADAAAEVLTRHLTLTAAALAQS
nr:Transcriptional regulator, GntR family [Kibdelosporangium sp. MJ126-NF4]